MARRKQKFGRMTIIITRRADRYIRSVARRSGVSPSKVMAVILVLELDKQFPAKKR